MTESLPLTEDGGGLLNVLVQMSLKFQVQIGHGRRREISKILSLLWRESSEATRTFLLLLRKNESLNAEYDADFFTVL